MMCNWLWLVVMYVVWILVDVVCSMYDLVGGIVIYDNVLL